MFIDKTTIIVQSGKGGKGAVSWDKSKGIAGIPNGGNGGAGGSVFVVGEPNMRDLSFVDKTYIFKADKGVNGLPNRKTGKGGKKLIIKLPIGSVVRNADTGELIADITYENNKEVLVCQGGIAGIGSAAYAQTSFQPHIHTTDGGPGESKKITIELKSIADVGLVGFPNAGKSSLLTTVSNKMARIGAYPFTTLIPNLAVISNGKEKCIMADIPGIVEDAHKNRGLGLEFLRHIERCKYILLVVDAASVDGRSMDFDIQALKREVIEYDPSIWDRLLAVVANKMDIVEEEFDVDSHKIEGVPLIKISTSDKTGIQELKDFILSKF